MLRRTLFSGSGTLMIQPSDSRDGHDDPAGQEDLRRPSLQISRPNHPLGSGAPPKSANNENGVLKSTDARTVTHFGGAIHTWPSWWVWWCWLAPRSSSSYQFSRVIQWVHVSQTLLLPTSFPFWNWWKQASAQNAAKRVEKYSDVALTTLGIAKERLAEYSDEPTRNRRVNGELYQEEFKWWTLQLRKANTLGLRYPKGGIIGKAHGPIKKAEYLIQWLQAREPTS